MKKGLLVVLALIMVLGLTFSFVGCGNNTAEENEVMSYLRQYNWYYENGGKYNMITMYQFNSDGSYTSVLSSTLSNDFFEGTFKINTDKDTIKCKPDGGKEYTFTYSLYNDGMKLYSDTKEYKSIEK